MRRLVTSALSASILPCIFISYPQWPGLHSIRRPAPMTELLRAGAAADTSLRPAALPAQSQAGERSEAPGAQESIPLEPGKPIERELSGSQSHSYRITMTAGQYLQVSVDQRGIDVLVTLFAPDREKRSESDDPNGTQGSEIVTTIAEAAGSYRIEVSSLDKKAKPGRYEIKMELREARAEDKDRVEAGAVFREAQRLENGTLDERRKSIESILKRRNCIEERAITLRRAPRSTRVARSTTFLEICRRRWRSTTRR